MKQRKVVEQGVFKSNKGCVDEGSLLNLLSEEHREKRKEFNTVFMNLEKTLIVCIERNYGGCY